MDASDDIKILDFRVMKELLKNFLADHFYIRPSRVRVGILKYSDRVEVPISLGDYDNTHQLLARISDTRRMKGAAKLGHALRDSMGEFLFSGPANVERAIIVVTNGKTT
jgi:hypothetical protein